MTVSDKRSAAARANGALSHGPITPEGKARSAQNACKHGLLAKIAAVQCEGKEAFNDFEQGYYDRFQPADQVEVGLVEDMTVASWHLRRAFAMETSMLDTEMDSCTRNLTPLECLTQSFTNLASSPTLTLLHRYQTRLHHMHSRLLRDFIILRSAIPAPEQAPGDSSSAPSAPSAQPDGTEATLAPPEPQPCSSSASEFTRDGRLRVESPAAVSPATPPLPNEPKTPLSINKTHHRIRLQTHRPTPRIDLILRRARRRLR